MMSAKECLKDARYKLGLTQREFGDFLGISGSAISLYETGARKPSFKQIRKIVNKLKTKNIIIEYSDLKDL